MSRRPKVDNVHVGPFNMSSEDGVNNQFRLVSRSGLTSLPFWRGKMSTSSYISFSDYLGGDLKERRYYPQYEEMGVLLWLRVFIMNRFQYINYYLYYLDFEFGFWNVEMKNTTLSKTLAPLPKETPIMFWKDVELDRSTTVRLVEDRTSKKLGITERKITVTTSQRVR